MILSILAFLLLLAAGTALLIVRDWRMSTAFLALQYLGMFLAILTVWPFSIALIKLMVGWMVATVLSTSATAQEAFQGETLLPMSRVFRITLAALILVVVLSIAKPLNLIVPEVNIWLMQSGLLAVGLGLAHIGISTRPYRIIVGLLTILSGFEIIYSGMVASFLVIGLLAGINLALALAGIYFGLFLNRETGS